MVVSGTVTVSLEVGERSCCEVVELLIQVAFALRHIITPGKGWTWNQLHEVPCNKVP